jgi:hypothetical protein
MCEEMCEEMDGEMCGEMNSNKIFDIVIALGPNDVNKIRKQLEYTKKNVIGYRNIYIIYIDGSLKLDGCIIIPESMFPFTINTVAKCHGKLERNGWYLQQLLKLYAGFIIPNILDKYLVIDADTFFLKPTIFYKDGKSLYNYSHEYNQPYFHHMQRLHPEFIKMDAYLSGICHHMMFESKYVSELIFDVESRYNFKDFFYNIFLQNVTDLNASGASEYEIYFNYMLRKYPRDIILRKLNWCNSKELLLDCGYDYVSCHWHL